MIVFIGSGVFIGGLIGARLAVLALIPATALILGIAGLVAALGPDWSLANLVVLLVFLQLGYLGGAGLRLFVAPLWISKGQPLTRLLRAQRARHQ